jgi:hypothetical protein
MVVNLWLIGHNQLCVLGLSAIPDAFFSQFERMLIRMRQRFVQITRV